MDEDRDGSVDLRAQAGRYLGLGLNLALATLLFLLVGWWLDGKLGTTPWLLLLGAAVGATAGFYSLYHHVTTTAREEAERKARRETERESRDREGGPKPEGGPEPDGGTRSP